MISGPRVAKSKGSFSIGHSFKNVTVDWSVEEEDKDKVSLTVSGDVGEDCSAELIGTKTVQTKLTAIVKYGDTTVATLTKNISLLGTFSGTYSVPASTVNGVSFPAIVNRPFTDGATLQARAGTYITINSVDLNYYSSSWSGSRIENWTVGLDFIRFSLPKTASTSATTTLEFKGVYAGGTARVRVLAVNPPTPPSMNLSHDGMTLSVIITKEEEQENLDYAEYADTNDASGLDIENIGGQSTKESADTWIIEVLNVTTGAIQDKASVHSGQYRFDTSRWQPGIYIVRASNGLETISKKVTIK